MAHLPHPAKTTRPRGPQTRERWGRGPSRQSLLSELGRTCLHREESLLCCTSLGSAWPGLFFLCGRQLGWARAHPRGLILNQLPLKGLGSKQALSEVLGIRTSTFEFGGSVIQPTASKAKQPEVAHCRWEARMTPVQPRPAHRSLDAALVTRLHLQSPQPAVCRRVQPARFEGVFSVVTWSASSGKDHLPKRSLNQRNCGSQKAVARCIPGRSVEPRCW